MKILIAGAGEVGYHLIENLYRENLDLLVIDNDVEVLEKLTQEFEVQTDFANIITSDYLKEDNLKDTDLFLAITNSDQTNMIACKMAKEAGVKKTICRIRRVDLSTEKNRATLESLGIDWAINPVSIIADELYRLIYSTNITDSHEFAQGKLLLLGFKITQNNHLVGKKVGEFLPQLHEKMFQLGIVKRREMSVIPNSEFVIQAKDVLFFFCRKVDQGSLKEFLGLKENKTRAKRIYISGGGHVGVRLAMKFENDFQSVRVIEKSYERCLRISEKLQQSLILNFDGTDQKQLIAEGIEDADFFFAVTNKEEINIASSLIVSKLSGAKTVCLVKQPELNSIIEQSTPIDLAISPRVLMARHLVKFVQAKNVATYFSLSNSKIEVLEIRLPENGSCLGVPLQNLDLPADCLVAYIRREGQFIVPNKESRLQKEDVIVVVMHKIDRKLILERLQTTVS